MTPARTLRDSFEPFHALCYFVPEVRTRYVDELGQHPWTAYFAQRAGAMGAVGASVVTAAFYGFSPRLVGRSIPSIWEVTSPAEAVAHRHAAVRKALDRLVGPIEPSVISEASALADRALEGCRFAGRPLASAHAAVTPFDDPLTELWRRITALREYRGDGHVIALVHIGLGPIESLITSHGFGDLSPDTYRKVRGWTGEDWDGGLERCRSAGWIDDDGHLTDAGTAVRWEIESETDRLFEGPLEALGPEGTDRLSELMSGISAAVVTAGGLG